MARKRKSRAAETSVQPEEIQHSEAQSEHSVAQSQEAEEALGDYQVAGEGVEFEEQEGEDAMGGEGEETQQKGADWARDVHVLEREVKENPSENVIPENEGESEGRDEEDDDELEDESLEKILEPFSKDQLTRLIKEAAEKYPDILESVNKLADADPSHRKIFVHGLGWDSNTELVMTVFGKYGEIEDCKVVMDKNSGKAKGYAFILFKHRDGSRRALKEPQKMIEGRMASCQLASAGPIQAPPPTATAAVPIPPPSEYTQRKIYVSNVSAELDVPKLVEFFSKFGEIEEGPLGLDKETGKPRGFCLFVYKSVDSAKKALAEPHKKFEGQILHCQKAVDGPKLSKVSLGMQHFPPPQQQQPRPQYQHRHQGQLGHYHQSAKRGKYGGGRGGMGHTGGHLMAPSAGSAAPSMGFGHTVPPAAIGQAVAALLATQGASLGIGNLLGGIGSGVNPQGGPHIMSNSIYGGQGAAVSYGGQPGVPGVYTSQPQMGQGGVRPHQGGAPYMGHGL